MRPHLYFRSISLRTSAQMTVINLPASRTKRSPAVFQNCLEHYKNDTPLTSPKKDRLYPADASAKIASMTPFTHCVSIISFTKHFYNIKRKTRAHYQRQNMLMHSLNLISGTTAQNWLKQLLKQYGNIKAKTVFGCRLASLSIMEKLRRLTR